VSDLREALDRAFAGSFAWGQVSRDGKEHALRQHWSDDDLWATACAPRNVHRTLAMYSIDNEPTGGRRGLCLQPACRHARRVYFRVHADASGIRTARGSHLKETQ
jgi:hypothetical protein